MILRIREGNKIGKLRVHFLHRFHLITPIDFCAWISQAAAADAAVNDAKLKARKESQAELAEKKKALERAHAERIRELKRQAYGITTSVDDTAVPAPAAAITDVAVAAAAASALV